MHWRIACRQSPHNRAARIHKEKWIVTMVEDIDGMKSAYCDKADGIWESPAPPEMLGKLHLDWEPVGTGNGLERAKEIAERKKKER